MPTDTETQTWDQHCISLGTVHLINTNAESVYDLKKKKLKNDYKNGGKQIQIYTKHENESMQEFKQTEQKTIKVKMSDNKKKTSFNKLI